MTEPKKISRKDLRSYLKDENGKIIYESKYGPTEEQLKQMGYEIID